MGTNLDTIFRGCEPVGANRYQSPRACVPAVPAASSARTVLTPEARQSEPDGDQAGLQEPLRVAFEHR